MVFRLANLYSNMGRGQQQRTYWWTLEIAKNNKIENTFQFARKRGLQSTHLFLLLLFIYLFFQKPVEPLVYW